jgi:hypothetical protein
MGWVVNAMTRPLYPRERHSTHCIRGWVGLRAGLDGCGKSRPYWDSIPGPSSPWRVAIPPELSPPSPARQPRYKVNSENFHFGLLDIYSCVSIRNVFNLVEWRTFLLVWILTGSFHTSQPNAKMNCVCRNIARIIVLVFVNELHANSCIAAICR